MLVLIERSREKTYSMFVHPDVVTIHFVNSVRRFRLGFFNSFHGGARHLCLFPEDGRELSPFKRVQIANSKFCTVVFQGKEISLEFVPQMSADSIAKAIELEKNVKVYAESNFPEPVEDERTWAGADFRYGYDCGFGGWCKYKN